MRLLNGCLAFVCILSFVISCRAYGDEASTVPLQTVAVAKTYNNRPFDYQMRLLARRDGFCVYRLTYPSPVETSVKQNNTVFADFYLPNDLKSDGSRRPAVVMLHVLDGDMRLTDVACSMLVRRGIVAVMPTLPYYGPRAKASGWEALLHDPRLFLDMAQQSIEDIRRTFDLLASRLEINSRRIDIAGISLGGILGASVASREPRCHRAALLLAGGDLPAILNHARDTLGLSEKFLKDTPRLSEWLQQLSLNEREAIMARIETVDPLKLAPALRQRAQNGQVLMVNVSGDEVIPRACTEKLAAALGISDRVAWVYGQEHQTFAIPEAMCKMTEFLAQDLPSDVSVNKQPLDESTPASRANSLVHQMKMMFTAEPERDHCHVMTIDVRIGSKDTPSLEARVQFVRGTGHKFALKGKLPLVGDIAIGQRDYPWMLSNGKTVIAGIKEPVANHNPLNLADPRKVAKLHALTGLFATLEAIRLESLHYWIDIQDAPTADSKHALRVTINEKFPGSILFRFRDDGKTPTEVSFDVAGVSGMVAIRDWQFNAMAKDTMFNPPADMPINEVEQADLYRTFATIFDLAMQ